MAGDADEEFEYSGKKIWMIRDASRLLFRIIDEFPSISSSSNKSSPNTHEIKRSFHPSVDVSDLTDRPEWESAKLKLLHFGRDLSSPFLQTKYKKLQEIETETEKKMKETERNNLEITSEEKEKERERERERNEEVSLIDKYIKQIKAIEYPKQILLQGPRGCGKSMALNQTVLYARKRGWICLFISTAWEHVHGGMFIEPCTIDQEKGMYDNPIVTVAALRSFFKAHNTDLRSQTIRRPESLKKYQPYLNSFLEAYTRVKSVGNRKNQGFITTRSTIEDEDNLPEEDALDWEILSDFDFNSFELNTLEDLVILGIAFRDIAGPVFMDIVEELKLIENRKVLIAIDQYNTWLGKSGYQYEHKPVNASDLCVPHALSVLTRYKEKNLQWNMKNGMVLVAMSYKHPEGLKDTLLDTVHSLPLVLNVPVYSQVEFLAAVKYSMYLNRIEDMFTTRELLAFRSHCGSNPRLVRKECVPFFFPLSMDKVSGDFLEIPQVMKEMEGNDIDLKEIDDSDEDDEDEEDEDDDELF
eukprot:CAMPEP_0182438212 /NCGR_PEP_ID=MMETSP1167-20130531/85599_1 /TAXON_ID=2988 /ORGANISM="Mallomonas Sp, Strain CCMP3275" /LENGTH=526 /DNA_ID=CAMNT_0024631461 /DNA_START=413 /DNA_END=1993 /DNA_ORIENTATION=-